MGEELGSLDLPNCPVCGNLPSVSSESYFDGVTEFRVHCSARRCGFSAVWDPNILEACYSWRVIVDAVQPAGGIPVRELTRANVAYGIQD